MLALPRANSRRVTSSTTNRIKLGTGKETYERAIAALRNWKQFGLGLGENGSSSRLLKNRFGVRRKRSAIPLWLVSLKNLKNPKRAAVAALQFRCLHILKGVFSSLLEATIEVGVVLFGDDGCCDSRLIALAIS